MQQVFSELKSINLNAEQMKIFPTNITDGMQIDDVQTDEMQTDEEQMDEMHTDENLTKNEIIIGELLLQCEDSIQKGIYEDNCIQLIKQHIIFKNKNEDEIFNYLLGSKDKQQNI